MLLESSLNIPLMNQPILKSCLKIIFGQSHQTACKVEIYASFSLLCERNFGAKSDVLTFPQKKPPIFDKIWYQNWILYIISIPMYIYIYITVIVQRFHDFKVGTSM